MVDICEGHAYIDCVDISRIPPTLLRSRLAILPQDCVLVSGTVRWRCVPISCSVQWLRVKWNHLENVSLFYFSCNQVWNRRIKLSQSFFKKILSTNSCLHTLFPPERNNEVLSKLRKPLKYPVPYSRTKRYQSFLNYAVAHLQNNKWVCFIFLFLCCELCVVYFVSHVLYCIIDLYCSFYVVCVLPIQLLGCHNCNERLFCQAEIKLFQPLKEFWNCLWRDEDVCIEWCPD